MSYLKNQKRAFIMGVVILIVGCASKSDLTKTMNKPTSISKTTTDLKSLPLAEEGWGVNPKELSTATDINGITDVSWYTKKYSGKADDRSIELKSPSYMESTCRQAVKKENGKALIESAFISINPSIKPEVIAQWTRKEDLKKIEVANCKSTSPGNIFSECECLLSYKVEGGKKALMDKILQ